ncbi:MAG: malate dehydrogenase [Methanobacteriota archaeon]|nr:MAG: malate dehydrogenase [Euryarchaeota archaeon]
MAKVAILGATGRLGSFAAHALSHIPYVHEILLIGRNGREDYLEGLARDLTDSFAARGNDTKVSFACDIRSVRDSDIVVCTAGVPRQPGQDRLDLALQNARVVAPAAETIGEMAPDALIFMVSNPVDILTSVALEYSGMRPQQVFGLGTHLDSMRLKSLIAEYFHVHVSEVHTRIIGEHGESMVPLWSATTIGGVQISNLTAFSQLPVEEMVQTVKDTGELIIKQKGSTIYGPGEAIATLVRTILGDENRILTVSSYIKKEVHNIGGVCVGVPARVNRSGVVPVPIRIERDEVKAFRQSVAKIRSITKEVFEKLEQ